MSGSESKDRASSGYGGYKYQWARYVARKSLYDEVNILREELSNLSTSSPGPVGVASEAVGNLPQDPTKLLLRDIARKSEKITFGRLPEVDGKFKMGIVGSGVSGLFTALMVDELNKRIPELNITYDILEAGGKKRLGGRLYTHRFEPSEPEKHQYYDVGAMRFPKNEVMDRTFRLFNFLDIKEDSKQCPRLIKYYLYDEDRPDKKDGVTPKYFNDVRTFGNVHFDKTPDPYGVNKWLPKSDPDRIDDDIMNEDPNEVVEKAIAPLKQKMQAKMDELAKKGNILDPKKPDAGWEALMKADFLSTREFFRRGEEDNLLKDVKKRSGVKKGDKTDDGEKQDTKKGVGEKQDVKEGDDPALDPGSVLNGCAYNFNTIEWLETYALATGWYNQSLAETVFESLDFGAPKGKKESNDYWFCIEGGTQLLAERLASKLEKQPEFNKQVTGIITDLAVSGDITLKTKTTPPDGWDTTKPFKPKTENRDYFTVFNSTTLGALQRMDLSRCSLLYGTKQAIRSLNYGASCKVGMQFKEMWWKKEPWFIDQGGVGKTDLPLRVCVYPSYNLKDEGPGVLLCSYSWAQDAQRIAALIDPKSPQNEDELKELMLSNLAQLHAKPDQGWPYERVLEHISDLYITHHAYDWYHDPNMSGAFGYFGPGQFSKMWPQIIKPNGWLFLIGEAASAHHAWIVGSLESSVRAMWQLFVMLKEQLWKEEKRTFAGYEKAIEFLVGPTDTKHPDWELPFVGLPREIPERQLGIAKGSELQDVPDKDVDLSFVAAQLITSFYQMVLEHIREEKIAENEGSSGVQQVVT